MILDELFVVLGKKYKRKEVKIYVKEISESDSDY